MREKERLKMGGKEEKRGACRGESLIIYRPKNHAKKCGNGADEKDGQKCENGEVEMVRIKVEKGYMTTQSVDEEKQKRQGENNDGKKSNTVQSTGHFGTGDK